MNTQAPVEARALAPRVWAAFGHFNEPARRQRCAELQCEGRHLGAAAVLAVACCPLRGHA